MKTRHTESIPYEGLKNGTHLDIEVYYNKGGMNWFSGRAEPRGFYISVTPVTHTGSTTSYTMLTGVKQLLLEVTRYTDKQFSRAVELSRGVRDSLIAHVLEKERAA